MAPTITQAQLDDLVEELQLLRSGLPFHTHVAADGTKKRCSSPYCVDLTMTGIRLEAPNA
jgi:hypothetical protein